MFVHLSVDASCIQHSVHGAAVFFGTTLTLTNNTGLIIRLLLYACERVHAALIYRLADVDSMGG